MDNIFGASPAVPAGPLLPPNDPGGKPYQRQRATQPAHDPMAGAVSPFEDPSIVEQVSKVLEQTIEHTTMGDPVSDIVDLPVGLTVGGKTFRSAQVRELTGADEEVLVTAASSDAVERVADALLRAVVSIGDVPATTTLLDKMYVGDRDALLLGIRKVTYGKEIEFEKVRCQNCNEWYELIFDLDDIPIIKLDDPSEATYEVLLRRGRTAKVRMPTGADQKAVLQASRAGKNSAEVDSLLLSLVVEEISGPDGTVQISTPDDARALSMADRAILLKEISNHNAGPDYDSAKVTCPECNKETGVPLSLDILFRY